MCCVMFRGVGFMSNVLNEEQQLRKIGVRMEAA